MQRRLVEGLEERKTNMSIAGKIKRNLKKMVPHALKKRLGMAHKKHRRHHRR
jgi:hypothetical protein